MSDEQRSRVARACDDCRRRKRKCDGSSPSCASCASRGIMCFYTTDTQPRKRKRNDEYTLGLEKQIQVLTAKLQALEEQQGADSSAPGDASTARSSIADPSGELASNDWGDFEMHSAPAIGEISQLMWKMKLGTDGDVSFIGPSTSFHLSQNVEDNAEGPRISPVSACTASAPDSNRDTYLYDSNLHLRLFNIFVEDLNKQYSFIDSSRLDEVILPYNPHATSPLSLLQSAIFATASCFLEDVEAINIGTVFATQAEKVSQQCYRAYPGIVVVEALLILGWRELALDNDNMAWMYNCMCSGLATHLGLHAVTLQDNASTPSKLQASRIMAFWRSFRFDRVATFSLGRHCVIPVKRIRTRFPNSTYPSSMSLSQLVFDHECRFLMIFDTFMDQIYSFDFHEMEDGKRRQLLLDARDEILRLHQDMDIRIARPTRSSSGSILTLHMLHHMGLLLVQRPFLREDTTSGLYRMAIRSMHASAVSMNDLARNYRATVGFAKATVIHMQCILTAALMHLLGATSSDRTVERRSITRFRLCVESLKEMNSMRSRSAKAISLLQELANRWKVVRALPLELSYPLGQAFKNGNAQKGQSRAAEVGVLCSGNSTDGLGIHGATSGLGQTFHGFDGFPFDLWTLDNVQGFMDVEADIFDPADPFRDVGFP